MNLDDLESDVILSLRRTPQGQALMSFSEMMDKAIRRKCITYRRHGQHGELLKPMRHRFEVKGGRSAIEAFADNISMRNPLFERLMSKP